MIKIRNQAEFDAVFVTGIANLPQNEIIRIIPIPQGYEVKAPIVITKSNVIIQGYGVIRPKLRYTGTSSTTDTGILYFTGAVDAELENIIVEYLDIDGVGKNKDFVHGIYVMYCGKAQTTGLANGGYDASTVGKDKVNKMGVIIKDCWVQGVTPSGILLKNSANCKIIKNSFMRGVNQTAITMNASCNNIIAENIIKNISHGINLIIASSNNIVTANTIQNCIGNGINIQGNTNAISQNNTIIGNIIQSCNYGVNVFIAYNNTITGNILTNNRLMGIRLDRTARNTAVVANTITHAGEYAGIYAKTDSSGTGIVIMANTITQEVGTHIEINHDNALILGNIMTGAGTGLTMSGTGSKQVDNIKAETAVV